MFIFSNTFILPIKFPINSPTNLYKKSNLQIIMNKNYKNHDNDNYNNYVVKNLKYTAYDLNNDISNEELINNIIFYIYNKKNITHANN
tara:strand:- start:4852 stop:5115 length:264 start_codon:yes stop_codon:yes gene_type:complete